MKLRFYIAFYDGWIGFYYDRKNKVLYFCPLPFCVFEVKRMDWYLLRDGLLGFLLGILVSQLVYRIPILIKNWRER